ncbi:MAG: signal peptidase I, partial [Planctomycetota bacterium]
MTQIDPDTPHHADAKPHPGAPKEDASADPFEYDQGSIHETLESLVIAFIFAFVFRAFVVEAFVIPTGSMAPTLLGEHQRQVCIQCGYRFTVGPGSQSEKNYGYYSYDIQCPMCLYPLLVETKKIKNTDMRRMVRDSGDRILVLKSIYAFSEPRRWDVVVFKDPTGGNTGGSGSLQNYIKRLVGLPGEDLWVVNGDIFTRRYDDATGDPIGEWQIQRKPDRVQSILWQPVYHSDY